MKVLIIGGNKFFGKRLASLHYDRGDDVTLLNRGNLDDGFGDKVNRIKCDRTNILKMKEVVVNKSWDIVYDQICFDYKTAKDTCEIFKEKTRRYVFTSTQSVYGPGSDIKESDFDPKTHKFSKQVTASEDYGEAKRQAEVAFERHAPFPVAYVRFSLVLGEDDPSGRLTWHIDRVRNGRLLYFPSLNASVSMIHSSDAAKSLFTVGTSNFQGPINATGKTPIKLSNLLNRIESKFEKKADLQVEVDKENWSPYGVSSDWWMNTSTLQTLGFTPASPESWIDSLLQATFGSFK